MSAQPQRLLDVTDIGDVTLVRILPRKILDEVLVNRLRDELFALVDEQGKRKLLLDFSSVEYQSSAGLGPLIGLSKKLAAVKGKLAFCATHPRIFDVYEITKLAYCFGLADRKGAILDIPEAQALFKSHVAYRCPGPGCGGWARSADPRSRGVVPFQNCPRCALRFYVPAATVPDVGESEGPVEQIIAETYHGENISMIMDIQPWKMMIHGRLDLFTLDVVRQVWEALPQPRALVCDLDQVAEISPRGAERLVQLFQHEAAVNQVVLVSDKKRAELLPAFRGLAPVLSDKERSEAGEPSLAGAGKQPWVPLRIEE